VVTEYGIVSINVTSYPILDLKTDTTFLQFPTDLKDLRKSEEINVCAGSTFRYSRPQQFEFNYLRGANNNYYNYGVASPYLTKEMYETYSNISPEAFPKIKKEEMIFNVDSKKDEQYRKISRETNFRLSATDTPFAAAWMSEKNDFLDCQASDWVEFPIGHTLENYLGTNQAKLIRSAPEFHIHENLFRKLNNGELTDLLNQHMPGIRAPMKMADPLSKFPKSIIYNMKHHGFLQINLARGQRQQYDVQSATGKKFVIGKSTTYYTHGRSVVNLQKYAETHDVFQMYVHSGALHHFACKAPLQSDFSTRQPTKSAVSYRYEGDFRIEQVTVQAPSNYEGQKELIDKYIQGIECRFAAKENPPHMTIRSPNLTLFGANPTPYANSSDFPRSMMVMSPKVAIFGVFMTKELFGAVRVTPEDLILNHNFIKLNGKIEANYPALFRKDITISSDAKLTCSEITDLAKLNGKNISIQTKVLIIQ